MQKETENFSTIRSRGIYLLPNLFTISSLFAGFYAIVAALKGYYDGAAISIFIAMLMDALDGRVARLTNTMTAFGAELDNLTDMVSFGIAPALVMYSWALSSLGKIGWLAAFIYTVATALRLARFLTQIGKTEKSHFQGLSSTASAGAMASIVWVSKDINLVVYNNPVACMILAAVTVFLGVLMVSNLRYRSFKEIDLMRNVRFVVILLLVVGIVLISVEPAKVLFVAFAAYALSGPVNTIWLLRKRKKERHVKHKAH
jgi:CDP-diacylglycerol---serine O-phosphatidyltransferase